MMAAHKATIRSIVFDGKERPLRASVRTKFGVVYVRWRTFVRKRLWFVWGSLDAQYEAALVIEDINMLFSA